MPRCQINLPSQNIPQTQNILSHTLPINTIKNLLLTMTMNIQTTNLTLNEKNFTMLKTITC